MWEQMLQHLKIYMKKIFGHYREEKILLKQVHVIKRETAAWYEVSRDNNEAKQIHIAPCETHLRTQVNDRVEWSFPQKMKIQNLMLHTLELKWNWNNHKETINICAVKHLELSQLGDIKCIYITFLGISVANVSQNLNLHTSCIGINNKRGEIGYKIWETKKWAQLLYGEILHPKLQWDVFHETRE